MRTFTVRDLDRSPAKVLAAADHDGVARVRSRDGRVYSLRPEKVRGQKKTDWRTFARKRRTRLKALFPHGVVMTPAQAREFP